MRRVAELHFSDFQANPFAPQATSKIPAKTGRNHRHDNEVKTGADLESGRCNALAAPRGDDRKSQSRPEGQHQQSERASRRRACKDGAPADTRCFDFAYTLFHCGSSSCANNAQAKAVVPTGSDNWARTAQILLISDLEAHAGPSG